MAASSPTLADVAALAGVSSASASLVLNRVPGKRIGEATRRRVEQAARDLGYQPNRIAVNLARGRTGTLGVLLPDLSKAFYAGVVDGIEAAARERGLQILLAHSRSQAEIERRQAELLCDHRVDGLVVLAGDTTVGDLAGWLPAVQRLVPCVLLDEREPPVPVDAVASDDRAGVAAVVAHLAGRGRRRLGFLSAGEARSSARDRLAGFHAGCAAAGLDASLVAGSAYDPAQAGPAIARLLEARPDAIVCASDYLAAALLRVARDLGLRPGHELAVTGFADDPQLGEVLDLTSVDQSLGELGAAAVERLVLRREDPGVRARSLLVPTRLVVRGSSGG